MKIRIFLTKVWQYLQISWHLERKLAPVDNGGGHGWRLLCKPLIFIWHLPRNLAAFFVSIYQKTLSPDHGWLKRFYPYGYCRFSPSCSEYAKLSLKKDGFVFGSIKAFWRICRCNPWSKGGDDRP